MYTAMKKLIGRHYYDSADEAQQKIDVFFACGRLTADEYTKLFGKIEEVYANG